MSNNATVWSSGKIYNGDGQIYLRYMGGYLFVLKCISPHTLYKVDINNPSSYSSITLYNNSGNSSGFSKFTNDGSYLYLTNWQAGGIQRYDINLNKDISYSTSFNFVPAGTGIDFYSYDNSNQYFFMSGQNNNNIYLINCSTLTSSIFVTYSGFNNSPQGLCVVNNSIYVTNGNTNPSNIFKINFIPGSPPTYSNISQFNVNAISAAPDNIIYYNNTFFVAMTFNGTVIQLDNTGNLIKTITTLSGQENCVGLCIVNTIINKGFTNVNNTYLFIANYNIYQYFLSSLNSPAFSGQITCTNIKYIH